MWCTMLTWVQILVELYLRTILPRSFLLTYVLGVFHVIHISDESRLHVTAKYLELCHSVDLMYGQYHAKF
jgi:hypothetical protein